ncbi:uncharacterized protein LOC128603262 isoform X3 [Ictalurus furcatus]|uniref:uncharacterized protein LOC128603262 isoform X3 n=1 Tax=Ictalurus furcatus TaxID=66913 RepID=UPI00234FD8D4|nr:uncharacterized protein LOC128603262 isoform X3 [Ictalurus furcatus]
MKFKLLNCFFLLHLVMAGLLYRQCVFIIVASMMRTRSSFTWCGWNWRMWRSRSAAYSTSRPSCWSDKLRWKHLVPLPIYPRDRAPRTFPAVVSVTPAPTHLGPWVNQRRKARAGPSPPPVFEIPTRNRFAPLRQTRPNAVIVGDSIVRNVRVASSKGKVRTHCFSGACVLDVAAQVSGILKKDERIGAVVLHAGTNDTRLRQTEVLKRDFSSLIETVRGRSPTAKIIVSGPLPTYRRGAEKLFRPDGLHPSSLGAELLSDNISKALHSK